MKEIKLGKTNDSYTYAIEDKGNLYPMTDGDMEFEAADVKIYYDSGIYPSITDVPLYMCGKASAVMAQARQPGSVKTEKKARTSAENGRKGGRPTLEEQARRRVSKSPTLSQYESAIFYDWPNWDEHLRWIIKAPVAEIVDWAQTV